MRKFNLVKSLTRVNNITSLPFRKGLGLGRILILCLSLATFGVEGARGNSVDVSSFSSTTINGSHTTFSFSELSFSVDSKKLQSSNIEKKSTVSFALVGSPNTGCTLNITKVQVWGYMYGSNKTNLTVGTTTKNISSLGVDGVDGSYTEVSSEKQDGFGSSVSMKIESTLSNDRPLRIRRIMITYTITPNAPILGATTTKTINVNFDGSSNSIITLSDYFSTTDGNDFNPLLTGNVNPNTNCVCANNQFYATAADTYSINAYIAAKDNCHAHSAASSSALTVIVNRLPQTLKMQGKTILATMNEKAPTEAEKVDLNSLITEHTGNGEISYELMSTTIPEGKYSFDGTNFYAWHSGTATFKAKAATSAQYTEVTSDEFTIMVDKITPKAPELTWYTNDGVFNPNIEFVVGDLIKAVSSIPFTLESSNTNLATIFEDDGEYYAEIQQSSTNQQVTITANFEDVNRFNPVSYTINISRKMRQTITWEDKLNYKWEGNTITVPLTATANGNISYSLSEGAGSFATLSGTNLVLNGVGTAYITAIAAATEDYLEAVSTKRVVMRDPQAACDPLILEPGETIDLGVNQNKIYWFSDEPRQVYFEADKGMASAVGDLVVYEYYNSDWHNIRSIKPGELEKSKFKPFTIPMSRQARGVKFATEYNSYHRHIQNVQVALAQYFEPQTDKVTITTPHGVEKSVSFNVNYSNIQDPISVSISPVSNGTTLSVSPDQIGEDCGEHGTATITITLTPGISADTLTGYNVVFNNDKDVKNVLIPIEASVTKENQTITWNPSQTTFTTLDNIQFDATASSGLAVTYTSSDESIAKIQGNTLQVIKHGQVTITAHQIGSSAFNPAPDVSQVITIKASTPTIVTMPTVGNVITYGSSLSAIALTGGSAKDDKGNAVTGHFEWVSPNEIPHGGQQNYTVRFIPDNTNIYTSDAVSTETLAITVNKANQTLTWDVEDPIKVKKEDGDYTLTASSTSGRAITYTLSDPSLGTNNGNVLTPLISGDCKITAICPEDGDYNASNSIEKNLFIAGPDEITWKYKTGDHVWAGQNLNANGNLATAHNEVWYGKDETQWYLTVDNNTNPKTIYTATASDGSLVTISATTAGNDYYASVNSSIQIYIDRCYQGLVWDQSFVSYTATAEGYIDETVPLTAVAVDSLNKPTNLPIVYSVDNTSVAEITGNATDGWNLHIKGAGEATLTASVAQTNIYVGVSDTRKINVRREGEPCGSYVLIDTKERKIGELNDNTYTFDRPGETLTFKTRKYTGITLNANVTVEGYNIKTEAWQKIDQYKLDFTSKQTKTYTISEDLRKIKMYTDADIENNYRYISDLYITQRNYLRTNIESISQDVEVNTPFQRTFEISYSDVPTIQYSITNNTGADLTLTPNQPINNDCGQAGTYTFTLTGKWATGKTYEETITIWSSDGKTITIPIKITVKAGSTFRFNQSSGNWNDPKMWEMSATTEHGQKPGASSLVEISNEVTITEPSECFELEMKPGTNAKIIIAPTGGLTIYNGGQSGLNSDNLIIQSSKSNQGYIRISPDATNPNARLKSCPIPSATVEYASKGSLDSGANKDATWQYFGVSSNATRFTVDYCTWLYEWSEAKGWINLRDLSQPVSLRPFQGYAITQYGEPTYQLTGQLIMKDTAITLTSGGEMAGDNMIANSYPSPLDAKCFTEEDFEGDVERTLYIFNSGSWNEWNKQTQGGASLAGNTPGSFTAIPILSAVETGEQSLIAPLQAICIHASDEAKIHLNYRKHVWNATPSAVDDMNAGLHSPQRAFEPDYDMDPTTYDLLQKEWHRRDSIAASYQQRIASLRHRVRIDVYGENSGADHIYLLEKDAYSSHYDNGYDARKMFSEGLVNLYTVETDGEMAVSASDCIAGTYIGMTASDDDTYTLKVSSVIGDSLYLKDLTNNVEIPLIEGQNYSFNMMAGSTNHNRFIIVEHPKQESFITTSNEPSPADVYMWFDTYDLHIENINASSIVSLYASDGKLLYNTKVSHNTTIPIHDLPNGVYVVKVNDQLMKFVKH